jgi:polyhydroxyalkanoate synthesis regulator phasin
MAPSKSSVGDSLTTMAEQLVNSVLKPLGLVVLTRERIQEVLNDAAERGRVTRSDANELVIELVRRGRLQLDELLGQRPVFPIPGYDELKAGEVRQRLSTLTPQELRAVRDYEKRHANRKSVLKAIKQALQQA